MPEVQEAGLVSDAERTEYRDGALLTARALADDGAALVAARETHQCRAHSGGVIAGLHVALADLSCDVSPGAAIDARGRLLLLDQVATVDDVPKEGLIAVWLRSDPDLVPKSGSQFKRVRELVVVEISLVDDPDADLKEIEESGVLLAIFRRGGDPSGVEMAAGGLASATVDRFGYLGRRYVGAVGSRIAAPSGGAEITLGPQSPRDPRRFAIGVRPAGRDEVADVFSWESTGTIRHIASGTLDLPAEDAANTSGSLMPALVAVGTPSPWFASDDFLDAGEARDRLLRSANASETEGLAPRIIAELRPQELAILRKTCDRSLIASLLAIGCNRLIRQEEDDVTWVARRPSSEASTSSNAAAVKPPPAAMPSDPSQGAPNSATVSAGAALRRRLEEFFKDLLVGQLDPQTRGMFFQGAVPVEKEPVPDRLHLVELKKDGRVCRQLRITIPNPGPKNHPNRYRCSIGVADDCRLLSEGGHADCDCSEQTGTRRGILSVLADKSVEIHKRLNVYADHAKRLGLLIKLEPQGGAAANATPAPAPILTNVSEFKDVVVKRVSASDKNLELSGKLNNISDQSLASPAIYLTVAVADRQPGERSFLKKLDIGVDLAAGKFVDLTTFGTVHLPERMQTREIRVFLTAVAVTPANAIAFAEFETKLT
jgi:hypothetical protein